MFSPGVAKFASTQDYNSSERLPGGPVSPVMTKLDTNLLVAIRRAAKQLRGAARRNWFAWACRTYAGGSPRAAETLFGWNGKAVARGLGES